MAAVVISAENRSPLNVEVPKTAPGLLLAPEATVLEVVNDWLVVTVELWLLVAEAVELEAPVLDEEMMSSPT